MSDWIEVGTGITWDFNKDKQLIGVYLSKEENVGLNHSTLYKLKTADGTIIGVWGNKMLDDRFKSIDKGDDVRLEYQGMVTAKNGKEYHNFKVFHRKSEVSHVPEEFIEG